MYVPLHTYYCLFPLSSYMHVCPGGDLLWAFSQFSIQGGLNAFHLCAEGGHLAIAQYLAPKIGGDLFDSDDNGYTALHWSVQTGHLFMVEYLVKSQVFDVKARDKVGLHCLLLVFILCILWPLWTHLLHGHSRHGNLYTTCVTSVVCVSSMRLLFCSMCTCAPIMMWCTVLRYVSLFRLHSVSLTLCAVGHHSTFESSSEWPCRGGSVSAGKWQQGHGTEQCGLTKENFDFLWSSNVVSWSLYSSDSSSNPLWSVA